MDLNLTFTREITWLASLLGIIVWVLWIVKRKDRWLSAFGPLTYFGNSFAFYSCAMLGVISAQDIIVWSTVVRFHSIFLFILYAVYTMKGRGLWTQVR